MVATPTLRSLAQRVVDLVRRQAAAAGAGARRSRSARRRAGGRRAQSLGGVRAPGLAVGPRAVMVFVGVRVVHGVARLHRTARRGDNENGYH